MYGHLRNFGIIIVNFALSLPDGAAQSCRNANFKSVAISYAAWLRIEDYSAVDL